MKLTNRIISLLLALVMVLGMLPASVFASDDPDVTIVAPKTEEQPIQTPETAPAAPEATVPVATPNAESDVAIVTTAGGVSTAYDKLEAAFKAVNLDYALDGITGSTIKLLQDVTLESAVTIEAADTTLDLYGHTISGDFDAYAALSILGTGVVITDTSSSTTSGVSNASGTAVSIYLGGTLTIKTGKYSGVYALSVYETSRVDIEDGTFEGTSSAIFMSAPSGAISSSDPVVEVWGGTFTGGYQDIEFRNINTGSIDACVQLMGGTFPSGFSLGGVRSADDEGVFAVNRLLAEGCGFFSEAGTVATVAEGAMTTGTDTVMVGKLSNCEASLTVGEITTTYLTADAALAAANEAVAAGGTYETVTLKLLKNAVLANTLLNGFTLDLGGFTLTAAEGYNFAVVSGYTTVLRDSSTAQTGHLKSTLENGMTVFVLGTLTIEGGKISTAWRSSALRVSGVLNVEGGNLAGEVETNNTASVINISGGTFDGTVSRYYGGTINISGGTFHAANDIEDGNKAGALTISGGTFAGGIMELAYKDVTTFLAEGYVFADANGKVVTGDALGSTTVTAVNCVATVTAGDVTTVYDSFNAAMDYAVTQNGSTVKLMQNATGDYIQVKTQVTLDLNGKTLDMGTTRLHVAFGENGVSPQLTIMDSSEAGTGRLVGGSSFGTIECGYSASPAKVILLGGTVINTYRGEFSSAICLEANGILEMQGGAIEGENVDCYIAKYRDDYTGSVTISGGRFADGLQIQVYGDDYTSTENDLLDLLAEGCYFFSEAGTVVTVAEGALTTGTNAVTVGKLSDCEATVTVGETTTYLTADQAHAAADEAVAAGGTYETVTLKLLKDAVFADSYLNGFTLDLGGFTLAAKEGYNFAVASGHTTVIRDSSTAQTGHLTSTKVNGTCVNVIGTLTIQSGKFSGGRDGSAVVAMGGLNIAGGTFAGSVETSSTNARINISGGTFGDTVDLIGGGKANITGGTFEALDDFSVGERSGSLTISGGTFVGGVQEIDAADVTTFLAEGYVFADENGKLVTGDALSSTTVTVQNCVATVTVDETTTIYDSVDAALDYARTQPGSTVKLMQDCATEADGYYGYLLRNAALTLDLNGKTLSTIGSKYALYTSSNAVMTIRDSSTEQTGAITEQISIEGEIYGGSFQGVMVNDNLTIFGGTFGGDRGVSVAYNTFNLSVSGGAFNGTECDLYFAFSTGNYIGKTVFYGGTFPGGLQINVGNFVYADSAPTAAQILGEGYGYFDEAGVAVIPAADAYTTGTDTVTVERKAGLTIAMNKELYYKDDGTIKVTITTQQEELSGWLYIYIDGTKIDQESYSVSGGRQPLTNGKVYTKSLFDVAAGDREIYLEFVPDDTTMATGKSNTVAFTVEKIPNENLHKHFTTGETKVTYDGTVQAANVHTIYNEDNNFYLAPESYTLTYWQGETQVAEPVNAGTYTVKLTMAENDYYQAATNVEMGALVIDQVAFTLDTLDYTVPGNGTYSGEAFVATAAMKSGITGYGELKVEYIEEHGLQRTTTAPVAAGTYNVFATVTGGGNVMAGEVALGQFIIEQYACESEIRLYCNAEPWLWKQPDGQNAVYEDKTEVEVQFSYPEKGEYLQGTVDFWIYKTVDGERTEEAFRTSASLDENATVLVEFQVGAGTYVVEVLLHPDSDNYYSESTWTLENFVVAPKPVTLTPSGLEHIYDGKAKTITFENSTKNLTAEDFTVTYYKVNEDMGTITKVNRAVSSGKFLYVITLNDEHQTNYTFENPIVIDGNTLPEGTFDNAGFMDIVVGLPESQEPIYFTEGAVTVYLTDGTYAGNTLVNPNNTTPTYTSSNNNIAEVATDGTVTLKRTGTVTIFATSEKEGTTPVRASYTLNIVKKSATVTVSGLTTVYGEAFTLSADDLKITGAGLSDLDVTNLTFTGYTVGQGVGTYYITPAGVTSEAYELTFAAGTLTVQPKEIDASTVTVYASNKIYDGTTEAILAAALPAGVILSGDKVFVTAQGEFAAVTAGTDRVNVTALALEGKDADNYALTGTAPATAEATIEKATVTFTTVSKTYTYDGTEKALEITATTNNGLTVGYTVSYSGTPVLPGTYTVTVALTDTINYVADVSGLEGKTLTIIEDEQQSFTIGGLEEALYYGDTTTLTAENAEGTVTFSISAGTAATIDGTTLTAAGVGKVTVTATSVKEGYEDKTVTTTVTVSPRILTPSVQVTDRVYNGETEVAVTVTLSNVAFDDVVTATATARMVTADAGSDKLVYISGIKLSDTVNYILSTTSLQTSVSIAPIVIDEIEVSAENKFYDGKTNAAVTVTGSADILAGDDVTILATGSFADATAGENKTVNVTATRLTGADAGNYILAETVTATAEATIEKATVLFEIGAVSFIYDGTAKTVDVTAKVDGKPFTGFTVSYEPAVPTTVGTYTVTVTLTDAVNYTGAPAAFTMQILPADQASLIISGMSGVLDYGKVFTLTTNAPEGASVTWKSSDETIATVDQNGTVTIVDVDREVVITATTSLDNFNDQTASVTFTPVAKQVTFRLSGLNAVYNGNAHGVTVTPSTDTTDFTVTYTDENGEIVTPVNAGIYYVEVQTTGKFYTGSATGTLTIARAKLEGTLSMEGWTYGEEAKAPSYTLSISGITPTYSYTGAALQGGQPYGAGRYTVTAVFENANYETLTLTADFTIEKAMLTATADDASRLYGESNPALTVTVTGFVNGDDLSDLIVIPSASTVAVTASPVGTYEILVSGGRAENYELTYLPGTLTILPSTGSLYITGASRTALVGETMNLYAYLGSTRPAVTWRSSDETIAAVDENGIVTTLKAGEVVITATLADDNYDSAPAAFTLTVEKRTIALLPTSTVLVYNGEVRDVEFLTNGDFVPVVGENVQVSYVLTTDASVTSARNVGTYAATYEITDERYQGVGTFTLYINKATVTLKPLDLSKTYGEENPAYTVDPACLLGTDKEDSDYIAKINAMFEFVCTAEQKSVEGDYEILMVLAEGHSLTEDANYDFVIDPNPGKLTILNIAGGTDCPTAHFTDLNPGAWYHNAVDFVVSTGLMNGVSSTSFDPNGSTTRGMIVTTLWRLEGQPTGGESIFTDVRSGSYYEQAIAWAAANHIVLGYGNGMFAPDKNITREEAAVIFYRYAAYKGCDMGGNADLSNFTDSDAVAPWSQEAVAWAVSEGLINGRTNNSLDPEGTAKRVELAAILMRLVENVLK